MRFFGKRAASAAASYYKGVPVVDLLNVESRKPMAFMGAEGPLMWVRLALIAAIIVGVGGYYYTGQGVASYNDLEATAVTRAAAASNVADEANSLQDEIDALNAQKVLQQKDLSYLHGNPGSLVTAIQSVISLDVAGVSVVSIETSPPDEVDVRIATSNIAEWRRLIGSQPGVARVLALTKVGDDPTLYDVQLLAGGQ